MMCNTERTGLSRAEVVVILAIILLLSVNLIPAIDYAREVARQHSCTSNLRQIGLALHDYHDLYEVLPPATIWGAEDLNLPNLITHKDPTPVEVTRENWVLLILPQLGATSLADSFDLTVPMTHPHNAEARTTEYPAFTCPSDPYHRPDNQYLLELADGSECRFARGNYAINGGSEYVPIAFGTLSNPGPTKNRFVYSEETREFQWWGNGVAGINKSFSLDDFRNGGSSLIAVEEIRAGVAEIDPRGVWAFGQIGGSITWGHGVTGDDGGPNYFEKDTGPDDVLGGPRLMETMGNEFLEFEGMAVCDHCNENAQATARSKHPDGVNVAMMDGSVRFINNQIDSSLWHVLHSRETPVELFRDGWEEELEEPQWTEATPPKHWSRRKQPEASSHQFENSLGMLFVRVPGGEFVMGVPNTGYTGPAPWDAVKHDVKISQAYYLGAHEVTQQQFERVMGNNPSWHSPLGAGKEGLTLKETSQCPVENVSWDEAAEFCRRLSELSDERAAGRIYRLPTEAEWERASRAGRAEPIPLNSQWDPQDDSGEIACKKIPKDERVNTVPVGSYRPNPFGLFDMSGNVYEWVADYRGHGYYGKSPLVDPQGPSQGYLRVIRGWHWIATGPACKVYVAQEPWTGSRHIGFRVVCDQIQ